MKKNNSS